MTCERGQGGGLSLPHSQNWKRHRGVRCSPAPQAELRGGVTSLLPVFLEHSCLLFKIVGLETRKVVKVQESDLHPSVFRQISHDNKYVPQRGQLSVTRRVY